ncbi:MAG: complex I subunit 1 family protein [Anaeromyxobacteraceae bacterium]
MKRFVGMWVTFAALAAFLVVLGGAFYWAAGQVGALFGAWWGVEYVAWGASLVNVLTVMFVVLMISTSLLTVGERKWAALIQNRIGANQIKVFGNSLAGIPFFLADAVKMLTKERFAPAGRIKILYGLAPIISFVPVFAIFAVVPVGPPIPVRDIVAGVGGAIGAATVSLQVASLDVGLLYVFAISSLAVFGTSLAGWSSNNKFALLGGVRASSQMISYEVSLGLSLVGMMLAFQTLRLEELVAKQGIPVLGGLPGVGILLQPIGFLVFFTSSFAETKRAPFDLPEGESEIVGFFVEYSGMQWGLMFLAEFVEIVVLAGITTAIFFGGWQPILFQSQFDAFLAAQPLYGAALGAAIFIAKMIFLMWLQLVIRWLLPRFRYDQVQKLCWKILLPTSLANIFVTAAAVLIDPSLQLLAWIGVGVIAVIVALTVWSSRAPAPAAEHGHAHAAAGH